MSLTGWDSTKVIKISIGAQGSATNTETAVPILIKMSTSAGVNGYDFTPVFTELGNNSLKIAFEDNQTGNECYAEVDNWDSSTNTAQIYVRVPSIPPEGTDVYLYYDNNHADNTSYIGTINSTTAETVWGSHYEAVYHLSQDPSGTSPQVKDSTAQHHHGTSVGTMTSGDLVDFGPGKAISFDGTDDGIDIGDITSLSTGELTCEVIAGTSTADFQAMLAASSDANDDTLECYMRVNQDETASLGHKTSAGAWVFPVVGSNLADGAAHYYAWTWSDSTNVLDSYVDDVTNQKTDDTGTYNETTALWNIGRYNNTGTNYIQFWNGHIAEVRISRVKRTADFIRLSRLSLADQLNTYTEDVTFNARVNSDIGFSATIDAYVIQNVIEGSIGFTGDMSAEGGTGVYSFSPEFIGFDSNIEAGAIGLISINTSVGFASEAKAIQESLLSVNSSIGFSCCLPVSSEVVLSVVSAIGFGTSLEASADIGADLNSNISFSANFGSVKQVDCACMVGIGFSAVIDIGDMPADADLYSNIGYVQDFHLQNAGSDDCRLANYDDTGAWT